MVIVVAPFFSTWASGSVFKQITVRDCYQDNRFIMQKYKSRAGKRHQIQIDNAEIFKRRIQNTVKALKEG